jgi:Domain of unknown function (DUF4326)
LELRSVQYEPPTPTVLTRVVDLRHEHYDIYIGRYNAHYGLEASKWANSFEIKKHGTREQVVALYDTWIRSEQEIKPKGMPYSNHELLKMIPDLEEKILGCWCHPKLCHGHILVRLLKEHHHYNSKIAK